MTDSLSSPKSLSTIAKHDKSNFEKEWSCSSCTFLNSLAHQLCKMCNNRRSQSLSGRYLKSEEKVIDLTTSSRNDDASPQNDNLRSYNTSNAALSFTKVNSTYKCTVACTESARKKRKRQRSNNGSTAGGGGRHDATSNLNSVIEINDTDDDDHDNAAIRKSFSSKKNVSLRTIKDQVQNSIVVGDRLNVGMMNDCDNHKLSKLEKTQFGSSSSLSSSSSSMISKKSKKQSTLFGSVLPDTKKKRHADSSNDSTKKRPSRTTLELNNQDNCSDLDFSNPADELYKDKMKETTSSSFTDDCYSNQPGITIMDTPTFSQARHDALMKQARVKMKSVFGISSLRSLQPIAIESVLKGQSQIIIMATGGGKSLCYQLPAVVLPGLTIVISPLIALMIDQVGQLKRKGVSAELICSSQSQKENQMVMQRLRDMALQKQKKELKGGKKVETQSLQPVVPMVKLLYCTPELIQTERFQDVLTSLYRVKMLSLIVIDEAHCMSTWGHDFRPAYRKLSWLRTSFTNVPCMACTATATKKVIEEIKQVLCFQSGDKVHMSTFNRANIHYEVRYKDSMSEEEALQDLLRTIQGQHKTCERNDNKCSGIVYVHKRQDTTMIASRLQQAGIAAAPYHAGLKDAERKRVQQEWTNGTIQVAIATVAFGMGIDLAHVRYVIHWTLSKSIEGFYQESGRAGRDSLPSLSILYYSRDDASKFAFLIRKSQESKQNSTPQQQKNKSSSSTRDMDALDKMIEYCTSKCCRRKYLLHHFGEDINPKKVCQLTCDYCINPQKVKDVMSADSKRDRFSGYMSYRNSFHDNNNNYYGRDDNNDDDDDEDNYVDHDIISMQEWGYGGMDPVVSSPIHHVNHNRNNKSNKSTTHAGFSTAGGTQIHGGNRNTNKTTNSILSKYNTMEQQQDDKQSTLATTMSKSKSTSRSNLWSKINHLQQDEHSVQKHNASFSSYKSSSSSSSSSSNHINIPSHFLSNSNIQRPQNNPSPSTTLSTTTTTTNNNNNNNNNNKK